MKYIDVEKLIAEVKALKQRKGFLPFENIDITDAYLARGVQFTCDDIVNLIQSLQQEQAKTPANNGWIARDMNNDLHYFDVKPVRMLTKWWDRDYVSMPIDRTLFENMSWEDEPIEVELLFKEL